MLSQALTIAWAQWRVMRNHLPRTTFGSLLGFSVSLIWYGGFATLAIFIAFSLPAVPVSALKKFLGPALMGLFVVWQLVPLITLSGGWSLDLKKLQVFPIGTNTLLATEAILRVTGSAEMLLLTLGGTVGLIFHPDLNALFALCLLLYIPFNLLVSVFVRETFSRLLQRNRIRELLTVLLILIAVVPQFVVRLGYAKSAARVILLAGHALFLPWQSIATLNLAVAPMISLLITFGWLALAFVIARYQLAASLRIEESRGASVPISEPTSKRSLAWWLERPAQFFSDPVAAIISKEIRTLMRAPRFRVIFALSTVCTVVIILPMTFNGALNGAPSGSAVSAMEVYGIVILGDALLWNIFGFDGRASQIYFVSPVDMKLVFRAKNIAACLFVALQLAFVLTIAAIIRTASSPISFLNAILSAAVLTLFFLSFGNVSSVILARRVDPKSTLKKQAGGKVQLWIFGCLLGAAVLIGTAFLAGWAANSDWATVGTLIFEFAVGLLLYRFGTESAVQRAIVGREEFLTALSKSGAPVSS